MSFGPLRIVFYVIALVVGVGAVGWLLYRSLKRSEDPARLVFKWVLTVPIVCVLVMWVAPFATSSQLGAVVGVPTAALLGIVLAIIWGRELAGLVANPLGSLYDGGSVEPVAQPAYSIARSLQKKGRHQEAVLEIHKQLERFPKDVEGQLLLAQIYAEDMKDMPAAELVIRRFCEQKDHAPANVAFALYSLADWHLQITRDREAAQRALERVLELLPDSEFSLGAAHRIAHLGTTEMLLAPADRRKFAMTEGVKNLGLLRDQEQLKPAEPDLAAEAAECVKQLEQHPLDTEARERLAVLYADHYGRLDMATAELEQMIQQPHQAAKRVAHWLNLLADLQVRHGAGLEAAQQTLQRIVDRDPKAAAAELARNRLALLKLEFRAKDKSQAVKLGSYEQNIGLKRGLPSR